MKLKILFLILIAIPIVPNSLRNLLYALVMLIGTIFVLGKLKNDKYVLSLKKNEIFGKIFISSAIIIAYSFINLWINGISADVIERLIQLYACFMVLLVTTEYEWKDSDYNFCINIIRLVILGCIALWPLSGFKTNYYNGLFNRGNALGGAILCYMGIYLAIPRKFSKIDYLFIVAGCFLLYIANSRSSLLSLVVFIVLRFLFTKNIVKNKKKIFIICIIIFTLFPYLYMYLYESNFKDVLNDLSWKYFRKRFFSGRQELWGKLTDYISQKPLMGYGFDVTPETLFGVNLSSHNWYIQILLQMGLVGYLLLINILNIVWKALDFEKNNIVSLNSSAFLIGVLLWQCFEVSITQNNISIGILVWMVFGMGINKNLIEISKKNKSKCMKEKDILNNQKNNLLY